MVSSFSAIGYTWTTDTDWYHWEGVGDAVRDGGHTFYNDNGWSTDNTTYSMSGGSENNPEMVAVQPNEYLVFHTRSDIMLWWGDTTPSRPIGCTKIYAMAALELYRKISGQWQSVDADATPNYERSSDGQTFEQDFLHVFEQRSYANGDDYMLRIWVSGGWYEGATQHVMDQQNVTIYYRLML